MSPDQKRTFYYFDYKGKNLGESEYDDIMRAIDQGQSIVFINGQHSNGTLFQFNPGSSQSDKLGKLINSSSADIKTSNQRTSYIMDKLGLK